MFHTALPISIEVDSTTLKNCNTHLNPSTRKEKTHSDTILEYRQHRINMVRAKITVKIIEAKDALENCIQRQDFLAAQALKTQINVMAEDNDKLQCILNDANSEELNNALEER